MADESATRESFEGITPETIIPGQAGAEGEQRRMRVRVDERNMQTSYVNGFRTTVTAEEVILDLGINLTVPTGRKEDPVEMVFQANNRVILNCYAAKRLAGTLAQIVQHHEQQYGTIELNPAKRRVKGQDSG